MSWAAWSSVRPWIGPENWPRGRCHALREAGPSAHRVRRGEQVLLVSAPPLRAVSILFGTMLPAGEPPLHGACSLPGAGSIPMVHRALLFVEIPSWLLFEQPLAPAREVATGKPVMHRYQRVRAMATIASVGNASPPLSTRAWLARHLKRPGCRWRTHPCPRPCS